jgi:hypothetical protein
MDIVFAFIDKMNCDVYIALTPFCKDLVGTPMTYPGSGMAHGPDGLMHDVRGGSMQKAQCELELFLVTERLLCYKLIPCNSRCLLFTPSQMRTVSNHSFLMNLLIVVRTVRVV